MKRKYTLCFSLLTTIIGNSIAQPILGAVNSNPVIGNTFELVSSDYSGPAGASGANVTWDFTAITSSGSNTTLSGVAVGPSQYANIFPTATVDMLAGNGDEVFYNASAFSLLELGSGDPLSHTLFDNPKIILPYNFAYNSTFNDRYVGTYFGFNGALYLQGVLNATADAWGTLKIPGGTFTGVLRVHRVSVDSSSSGSTWNFTTADYYDWYQPGTHIPILSMGFNGWGNFCTYIYTTVGFAESAAFISSVNLFPNPASQNTSVGYTLNKASDIKISIIDILSREVTSQIKENQSVGTHQEKIPIAELPKGIYFVQFKNEFEQKISQKLIVN